MIVMDQVRKGLSWRRHTPAGALQRNWELGGCKWRVLMRTICRRAGVPEDDVGKYCGRGQAPRVKTLQAFERANCEAPQCASVRVKYWAAVTARLEELIKLRGQGLQRSRQRHGSYVWLSRQLLPRSTGESPDCACFRLAWENDARRIRDVDLGELQCAEATANFQAERNQSCEAWADDACEKGLCLPARGEAHPCGGYGEASSLSRSARGALGPHPGYGIRGSSTVTFVELEGSAA
jgi:hypothetical protein